MPPRPVWSRGLLGVWMAKTYQNILDEARVLLQDSDTPYRYTNTALLAKLNRGLQELARLRPDAFWDRFDDDTDKIIVPEIVTTDPDPDDDPDEIDEIEDGQVALSAEFDLPMQFYLPLVYFVAASGELVEDEFTNDGRAITLMGEFRRMLVGL